MRAAEFLIMSKVVKNDLDEDLETFLELPDSPIFINIPLTRQKKSSAITTYDSNYLYPIK